jgi:hypothetical protein
MAKFVHPLGTVRAEYEEYRYLYYINNTPASVKEVREFMDKAKDYSNAPRWKKWLMRHGK